MGSEKFTIYKQGTAMKRMQIHIQNRRKTTWILKSHLRYMDFAGSGIVHMCGGVGGLCGTFIMGPRKGRFEEGVDQSQFEAHNVTEFARTQMIGNQWKREVVCPTFLVWL